MEEGPGWPPRKEDLERLCLVEKLSAAKIARVYGLKYRNQKVAESTVLYHLRRNGIRRRDAAEHVRRVTAAMEEEWVGRYQAGESLKQIAGGESSPVTVYLHLRRRGVQLRDKVEAQIAAVTKYERLPFSGDPIEKAYLMGLRYGDLHVVRHGRAIRVRVSTTHPAMAELFDAMFSPYGHVLLYPRKAKLSGYEWSLECDLDSGFRFLLAKPSVHELEALPENTLIAFLAGLFDAEGSIILHDKRGRYNPEVSFTNTDDSLLQFVSASMRAMGFDFKLRWLAQKNDRQGITGNGRRGILTLWKFRDVQRILRTLPLRHQEKVEKSKLVLRMTYRGSRSENQGIAIEWDKLTRRIKDDRDKFVELAGMAIRLPR